jgi:hypothetical protein
MCYWCLYAVKYTQFVLDEILPEGGAGFLNFDTQFSDTEHEFFDFLDCSKEDDGLSHLGQMSGEVIDKILEIVESNELNENLRKAIKDFDTNLMDDSVQNKYLALVVVILGLHLKISPPQINDYKSLGFMIEFVFNLGRLYQADILPNYDSLTGEISPAVRLAEDFLNEVQKGDNNG